MSDWNPWEDGPSSAPTTPQEAAVAALAPATSPTPKTTNCNGQTRRSRKGEVEADQVDGMGILGLEVTGFKRLRAVRFAPTDKGLTVIGGRNAQGKTSILDAVECLFGGARAIPDVPVNDGAHEATIVAELPGYRVRRVIREDRQSALEVSRTDGTPVQRPQEFLGAMTGVLWFDPLEFLRQEPRQQAETLRKLLNLDWSDLDKERQKLYDERTVVGRQRDAAKGHAESMPHHPELPETEMSAEELSRELAAIHAHNSEIDAAERKVGQVEEWLAQAKRLAQSAREEVDRLQSLLDAAKVALGLAEDEVAEREKQCADRLPPVREKAAEARRDPDEILAKLGEIEKTNLRIRENRARTDALNKMLKYGETYDDLTGAIEEIDMRKRRQLAEAEYPVDGLGFSDDGLTVLYSGYPLRQASGAEQIRVAVAMAMAMSGKLKVALVDEGEKLDIEQLKALDETVREYGGQVLLTRVSVGDEVNLIVEDGLVAA